MKKAVFLISMVLFFLLLAVNTVKSTTSATVTATVTAQNISVAVTDGTVTYGTMAVGTSTSTLAAALNDTQTASNNGNVTESFSIKSQNATGGGCTWTLASTTSTDQYTHEFSVNSGSSWTAMTTDYQTLAASKAAEATQTFDLQLHTPSASSCYGEQSVDVTVLAAEA